MTNTKHKIRKARLAKGLNQQQLADKFGLSQCMISKLENNGIEGNTAKIINMLNYLGVK